VVTGVTENNLEEGPVPRVSIVLIQLVNLAEPSYQPASVFMSASPLADCDFDFDLEDCIDPP
jgi:hypothetical protein